MNEPNTTVRFPSGRGERKPILKRPELKEEKRREEKEKKRREKKRKKRRER